MFSKIRTSPPIAPRSRPADPPGIPHRALAADGAAARKSARGGFIYLACPWTDKGGGMFKVADYLIQAQAPRQATGAAQLRPLDTRGSRGAVFSIWVCMGALVRLVRGRGQGLRGVHVNMAERLSLLRKSLVLIVCRMLGIPSVLHLHAAQLHHFYRRLPTALQAPLRWVFSLPACVVVLGESARGFVVDELKVAPDKVEIVINGVPRPTAARREPGPGRRQQLLFLGSDWQRKGLFDLLPALARAGLGPAQVELVIAGHGDIEACRRKARACGVEALLRFEGWADQAKAAALLAQADALVLPSHDEGLPLVILEALANGVAVVCTPVGEIASVLTDGVDACFVTPGDIGSIADGLCRVLRDEAFRLRLERRGRQLHEQQFSIGRFFARIAQIHRRHFGVSAAPGKGSRP
ncbi:glycosyltransferase [Xylophilus rhododendri]|uniref:Glycosyltransferase n=1 Tax=Xylophilus rhododendri TaxID=2697032 RepID=A0A857J465_9BURK|nr:glycosyltransferase family 4 protein [Xylophilus rhododendri]QHI98447.1 glycosyltransferase [Xylophilus rhododendri]